MPYPFPAEFIGVENILGTLEKDKKANFIICSSDIFEDGEIYENWTNGIQNIINEKNNIDFRGYYTFTSKEDKKQIVISGTTSKLKMEENISDSTSIFYEVSQENNNIFFNSENITIRGFLILKMEFLLENIKIYKETILNLQ